MLSKKSIRSKFFLQLVSTVGILIVVFSIIAYQIIKINILQNEQERLIQKIELLIQNNNAKLVDLDENINKISFTFTEEKDKKIINIIYPYKEKYIIAKEDITQVYNFLNTIFLSFIALGLCALSLIIFYSFFISKIFATYLHHLSLKISKFDDNVSNLLEQKEYPYELKELIININHLVKRIQNYNLTQKELFIGIAHELKTPLAVIKTKNDVTLMKDRDIQYYKDTINQTNNSVNNMNNIISSVLKIGRQEGAQFEESKELDIIKLIEKECKNYALLGIKNGQKLQCKHELSSLNMKIQSTLFIQILSNFIQNAFKFSPANSTIYLNTYVEDKQFILEVLDNGDGVDENNDYFAPFKRYGKKDGVGLGLFLSKQAATALKAKISLENRKDSKGAIAKLIMNLK